MILMPMKDNFHQNQNHSYWSTSANNTSWCLLGCTIGDTLTVLFYQWHMPDTAMLIVLCVIAMGIVTSMGLETLVLIRQMPIKNAIQTAFHMSVICMLVMKFSAHLVSVFWTGEQAMLFLSWQSLFPSWITGFLSTWPYNYYQLKKHGKICH